MKEQNEKEKEKGKKKVRLSGEKRFYMLTALGCAVALVAIIVVAIAVSGGGEVNQGGTGSSVESVVPPENSSEGENNDNEQVVVTPEGMIAPVESVSILTEHGFYENTTLGHYAEHKGVDFHAAVGVEVLAVEDGVIESIYREDMLLGTEITIDHGDGLKSVYRFVTEVDGLKAGDRVKKGDVIATVAEPTGSEYKFGSHLHFEILKNNVSIDPAVYLTLEEK